MNPVTARNITAQEEASVKSLYEDAAVAGDYIRRRFGHAWGRLLHCKQAAAVNRVIKKAGIREVLEIAPGPARLATDLKGVRRGLMVDNSAAMLHLAQRRLEAAGLAHLWEVRRGNAFQLEKIGRRFNFVFTFRFIRHFRAAERDRLLRSIGACLEPGGLLMFDVVNGAVRLKIDSRNGSRTEGELDVFDETYSPELIRLEMSRHGFQVVRLIPVIKYFSLQAWLSYRLADRLPAVAWASVCFLEAIPSKEPLEWIALCRKTA